MADENNNQQQTDVNSQNSDAAPSSADEQNTQAKPPVGENSDAAGGSEQQKVPYPRFNEVIQERNQERVRREAVEARLHEMESRLLGERPNTQARSHVEAEVQRLKDKLQIPEETAREFVQSTTNVARAERQDVEARLRQFEINEWSRNLESKYKDYRDMVPVMEKEFANLSQSDRATVASSPVQLEMFYHYVRNKGGKSNEYQNGANDAYNNIQLKKALSSTPGSAPAVKGPITRESIAKMSIDEYKKRLPEINDALAKGLIK